MTTTLAVANLKGGVGKTTLSVNLSAGLALQGYHVLLVDLDPQAHATASLGVEPLPQSLADCFTQNVRAFDAIVVTDDIRLDVLPATSALRAVNRWLGQVSDLHRTEVAPRDGSRQDGRFLLKQILAPCRENYDFILLDCPLLESLLENALIAADWLLMPVVPQYLSISGVQQMLGLRAQIQQNVGTCAQLLGLVLSQVDNRLRVTQELSELLRSHFGEKVFDTVIPDNVALTEAPSFGQSIFTYAPRSRGAIAFRDLTGEVLRRVARQ